VGRRRAFEADGPGVVPDEVDSAFTANRELVVTSRPDVVEAAAAIFTADWRI
jgi:hypothetical protein